MIHHVIHALHQDHLAAPNVRRDLGWKNLVAEVGLFRARDSVWTPICSAFRLFVIFECDKIF